MVGAQGEGGSATSEVSPSVASDIASAEDLEDDENWKKVVPSKRKALLHRERDALASRMCTSLGK
eukprot:8829835-Karenia_brevis.AAC.1